MVVAYGPAEAMEAETIGGWSSHGGGSEVGDVDEDGWDDLLNTGAEPYVYDDPMHPSYFDYTTIAFGDADRAASGGELWLAGPYVRATAARLGPADLDADGHMDLGRLVSDDLTVVAGPVARGEDLSTREETFAVTGVGTLGVTAVALDGAIPDDLLVRETDALVVASGPWSRDVMSVESRRSARLTGPEGSEFGAAAVVGDGWLYVGAPAEARGAGAVYGFRLDTLADLDSAEASVSWRGTQEGGAFGARLGLADVDADGAPELIVGATGSFQAQDDGAVFVYALPD